MSVIAERYMLQFFFRRLIRSNFLGEYLIFKIISLVLVVAILIPLFFSLVNINDIYLRVFHKELDFYGINRLISNLHMIYLFVIFFSVNTDYSHYYPFFRLPVNKKRIIKFFFIKRILFNKFIILFFALLLLVAFTNEIFKNRTVLENFKWLVTNFTISGIIGLVAFLTKKLFLTGKSILIVLIPVLSLICLSLFIKSDLFISLMRSSVNFLYIPVLLILIFIIHSIMRKLKLIVK